MNEYDNLTEAEAKFHLYKANAEITDLRRALAKKDAELREENGSLRTTLSDYERENAELRDEGDEWKNVPIAGEFTIGRGDSTGSSNNDVQVIKIHKDDAATLALLMKWANAQDKLDKEIKNSKRLQRRLDEARDGVEEFNIGTVTLPVGLQHEDGTTDPGQVKMNVFARIEPIPNPVQYIRDGLNEHFNKDK